MHHYKDIDDTSRISKHNSFFVHACVIIFKKEHNNYIKLFKLGAVSYYYVTRLSEKSWKLNTFFLDLFMRKCAKLLLLLLLLLLLTKKIQGDTMWIYEQKDNSKIKNYMDMNPFPKIQGMNLDKEYSIEDFFNSYLQMGFQGSNLGMAITLFTEIIEKRKEEKTNIYLSCTGNMISSGNRELILFLVKNKLIDAIVTSAAGIEEDIIKTIKPMHL